ncbi:MAG: hypothetical protein ACI4S3_03335, partial [Candidatus Gastranaerophilaceae bacterium]
TKPKKTDVNNQTGSTSDPSSVFKQGAQDEISNIIQGKFDINKTLANINDMILKGIKSVVKSAIIDMLLGGNDTANAAKDQAKTGANVAKGAKVLTSLQTKLIDGNLKALEQLVTTGQIDLQAYTDGLMSAMVQAGAEGVEAEILGEQNKELQEIIDNKTKENERYEAQIEGILTQRNIKMNKDDEGNITYTDSSGNAIDPSTSPELADLINKLNENNTLIVKNNELIKTNTDVISERVKNADKVTETVTQGIEDVAIKGQSITQTITNTTSTLIKEGVNEVVNEVMTNAGILQADAVTAGINAGKDGIAAAAAPGIAATMEVGTFGFGSGAAAKVLTNGVADGVAATVRTATNSAALGGIVTNLAAGQGLAQAVSNVLAQEVTNMVNLGIDNFMASATDGLTEQTDAAKEESEKTKENYLS